MNADLTFFEATSLGRIINRFGKDTNTIDDQLPFMLNIVLAQVFLLTGSFAVISYTDPLVIVVLIVVVILYYRLQKFYRASSRELRRLDSVYRSPVYALIADSLENSAAIRASNNFNYLDHELQMSLDRTLQVSLSVTIASQWLSIRLQLLGSFIASSLALSATLSSYYQWLPVSPGLLGLSLAYSLTIVNNLNGLVGSSTETEQEMISVERVHEYLGLTSEYAQEDNVFVKDIKDTRITNSTQNHASMLSPILSPLNSPCQEDNASSSGRQHQSKYPRSVQLPTIYEVGDSTIDFGDDDDDNRQYSIESLIDGWKQTKEAFVPLMPSSTHPNDEVQSALSMNELWPPNGEIVFKHVNMSYAYNQHKFLENSIPDRKSVNTTTLALCDLTLVIPSGSRVAVIGRSGSGKSSLLRVLLRLSDYQSGSVTIAGMELRRIPKRLLRSQLSVIPQDPLIFSASLRFNLDPFNKHSDDELYSVLDLCGLTGNLKNSILAANENKKDSCIHNSDKDDADREGEESYESFGR